MRSEIVIISRIRILSLVAVISQSASGPMPIRIGTAERVSEKNYADLERALPKGKRPWLLMGDPGQIQSLSFNVFLPATTRTSELRRGPAVIAGQSTATKWRIDGKDPCCSAWAQVAIEGRNFDDVQDLNDLNRPFRVIGRFSDAELLSLVRVLRNSDEIRRRLAIFADRNFPIVAVERGPRNQPANIILAAQRINDSRDSTAEITLRQEAEGWKVVEVVWSAP